MSAHYVPPRKETIRFKDTVCVREIAPLACTTEEKEQLWYSRTELDAIKESNRATAQWMELNGGESRDDELHCTRGLENKTRVGARRRRAIRRAASRVVFEEQAYQQEVGFDDCDAIAKIYYELSMEAHRSARIAALKDESFVTANAKLEESSVSNQKNTVSRATKLSFMLGLRRVAGVAA
jgi:hypothetical protein